MNTVAFQHEFRPAFPNVYGALDYRVFRETLFKIDTLLTRSGLEHDLISDALTQYKDNLAHQVGYQRCDMNKNITFHYKKLRHALRCNIARHLTGESYRSFSIKLSDSQLLHRLLYRAQ